MRRSSSAALAAGLALAGCASEMPPDYLSLAEAPADRALQGRRFDGIGEQELLAAATGVLHDLGFAIETKGAELGFIQGTKQAQAKAPEQQLVVLILAALAASQGQSVSALPMREDQTVSVLLTLRPARPGESRSHLVLVTFHSHVRQPLLHKAGALRDPVLYRSFFELLSKAIFLEAHRL
jgi:hypothetical protein